MNKITNILNLTGLGKMGFGHRIIAESGYPLENLPTWFLLFNEGTPKSHFAWKNYGNIIVFEPCVNTDAAAQNLSFMNVSGEAATIEFDVLFDPSGTTNWALFGVKFLNGRNLIGARIAAGKVEIVMRKVGTWSTISATPANPIIGHWKVTISNDSISVEIEGTPIVTESHTISGIGKFGLSGHRWDAGEADMLENFTLAVTRCADSIGGADGTEWRLDGELMNDCKICKS